MLLETDAKGIRMADGYIESAEPLSALDPGINTIHRVCADWLSPREQEE